jgi:hypothetical protein
MKNKQLPRVLPAPHFDTPDARRRHSGQKSKPDDDAIQEVAQMWAVTAPGGQCVPDRHTGDQNGIRVNQG